MINYCPCASRCLHVLYMRAFRGDCPSLPRGQQFTHCSYRLYGCGGSLLSRSFINIGGVEKFGAGVDFWHANICMCVHCVELALRV